MTVTIVDARTRPLEGIVLNHSEQELALQPYLFDAHGRQLETGRQKFAALESEQKVRGGNVLGLFGIEERGERLLFSTRRFPFRDYFALRDLASGWVATGVPVDKRLLGAQSALSMITITETADDHLVFGYRSGDHLANRYLSPSGFYTYQDVPDAEFLRSITFEKVAESLGRKCFSPVMYLGLSHDDRDSFLFVHVLYQKLPYTSEQVYAGWMKKPVEQRKHDHLLFVSSELKPLMDYVFHTGEHTFNYFSEPDVRFKNRKMISGPKEHLGKEYDHIENGVGALLLYIAHRYGPASTRSLCRDVVAQRIVSGIDGEPIWKGGLHTAFLNEMGMQR